VTTSGVAIAEMPFVRSYKTISEYVTLSRLPA
jgi:hypothetical protein